MAISFLAETQLQPVLKKRWKGCVDQLCCTSDMDFKFDLVFKCVNYLEVKFSEANKILLQSPA